MKDMSKATRTYLIAMYLAGALLLIPSLMKLQITEPVMFAVLCFLGSGLHILKVEGATERSHYTLSFVIFGFAMLQLEAPLALAVILVSNLAEWAWNKLPWFVQALNLSCYTLAAKIAIWVYTSCNPEGSLTSWQVILGIVLAVASFTLVNHLVIGVVLWLAGGENFKRSGIFDLVPVLIDMTMLAVGASLTLVWDYNPYALFLFLVPIYPLYLALRIPALERQTEIDQKTGLFNHQYFVNRFRSELQRVNRYDRPLSVIIADLDLLRNINNTYGHLAGDEVLKGVANILRHMVRDYDVVARFGGEEFAILLPETTLVQAFERAERIRQKVKNAEFIVPTIGKAIRATMSFGIAQREHFAQTPDKIIHNADLALYHSKLSGRNKTFAYMSDAYVDYSSSYAEPHTLPRISPVPAQSVTEFALRREYPENEGGAPTTGSDK